MDTRAASMHIRAQGTNMSSCNVVSHIVRLLFPGWCWNVHVVPRVTARPARVFRTGDPETLPLCAAACEHCYWHDTMLYWRGGLRIQYLLCDVWSWSRPLGRSPFVSLQRASIFFGGVQALTRTSSPVDDAAFRTVRDTYVGGRPDVHGQDTVPQFVRMLSCRVSSCTHEPLRSYISHSSTSQAYS